MRQTDPKPSSTAEDLAHIGYRSHRSEGLIDNDKNFGNCQLGSPSLSSFGRNVSGFGSILMRVHGPLGVVFGILDAFRDPCLKRLVRGGEFFDAFIRGVRLG